MTAADGRRALRGGRRLRDGRTLYWWVELLAIAAYYGIYTLIRNANEGDATRAYDDAKHVISVQKSLGLFHEPTIQHWALHVRPLIIVANYFYGSFHFVVTIGVGIFLYRTFSDDYPLWRNTLAIATGLALVGFITFPLMPPRLLHTVHDPYGFVDTLARYPTFWSFDSGGMSKISNQFAAMPSVHICWSTWCAVVLVPRVRPTWGKVVAACYPVFTLMVIIVTANHYFLDAAGGLVILALGYGVARVVTRAGRGPAETPPSGPEPAAVGAEPRR